MDILAYCVRRDAEETERINREMAAAKTAIIQRGELYGDEEGRGTFEGVDRSDIAGHSGLPEPVSAAD